MVAARYMLVSEQGQLVFIFRMMVQGVEGYKGYT